MGGLAHGGHAPVLIPLMMGGSALIIGATIDSLYGLIPLFGIFCLMLSAFFAIFGETQTVQYLATKMYW